ncbi:tRNA lysidine(34) synthetase TilS [Mycoplasmopsis sturni]|uniref:tRNA lysidine(34) synthetase TilS n=1 Tax=Mycoplasmopsis sturni TaxID=39047 RepID=UPI0005697190|nr:tRNA lysidine(34) synthetase TilS [Mycoplasmopsis sturni]
MQQKINHIIAVSGGSDSMYLLEQNKNKNVVVAYVNYNQREDSYQDQKLVEQYCKKNNLILEKLILSKQDYQGGNFQAWARKKRYDFFVNLSNKYNAKSVLIAHHKDDFLETCLIQEQRNSIINHWGIKQKIVFSGVSFERPLIYKVFKEEIINFNKKNKIPYRDDYTNFMDKYLRNKLRMKLSLYSKTKKELLIFKYRFKNLLIAIKYLKMNKEYEKWKKNNFSQDFMQLCKFKSFITYRYIHENFLDVNLTKGKINEIIKFILSKNRTSSYKLDNKNMLVKKQGKLI